ncbi:hypothetical protein [Tabrizicola sp. M-4]|uniref:hypothetical protein n=1 Tax=Tabrizicola sp. M-4 TaxID=3055847 RepID=UPI003DA9F9A7
MLKQSADILAELDAGEISLLRDRLAEADAGEFVSGDMVEEWVGSWFTSGELPPPLPPPARG